MKLSVLLQSVTQNTSSIDGVSWYPVRPMTAENTFLLQRMKAAWRVFIGASDAIEWDYPREGEEMTDRELLELAAKAAGISVWWSASAITMFRNDTGFDDDIWNPLTDDGDAFRLAVKLGLVIEIGYAARGFLVVRTNTDNWQEFREAWGNDPYATTRRAIVRAAAEIGKGMK